MRAVARMAGLSYNTVCTLLDRAGRRGNAEVADKRSGICSPVPILDCAKGDALPWRTHEASGHPDQSTRSFSEFCRGTVAGLSVLSRAYNLSGISRLHYVSG